MSFVGFFIFYNIIMEGDIMLDDKILSLKNQIIKSVQESIHIKSVQSPEKEGMPFGQGVYDVLQYALNLSESLGFRTRNMNNMIGYAEYGNGPQMIAVLGHLDVVPEGDGWIYPPFGGEIHDGKIYGRGALDDKGATIGALYALKAIKELNIPLSKRVRIIFGTNEETGSKCAKYYTEHEEIPAAGFTPDAQYPIINGEKGIVNYALKKNLKNGDSNVVLKSIKGGTALNVVPSYAEAVLDTDDANKKIIKELAAKYSNIEITEDKYITVKAHGKPAHGSTPQLGINAISILFDFLSHLDFSEDLQDFISYLNQYFLSDIYGEKLGIDLKDDISGKLTLNFGLISGDSNQIQFKLNIRYPVTKKFEDFKTILDEKFYKANIEISSITHKKSLYVDPDTEFIKKLQKVYKDKTGKEGRLLSIGAGTYAKSLKNIVAFGPIFEGEPDLDHLTNEYISINNLMKNVQIMAAAIYELAK